MDSVMDLLTPVMSAIYVPLDWILGWVSRFPPAVSIGVVGLLSGLGVTILQKYASRQKLLAQCRTDLRLLKEKRQAANASGDLATAGRLQGLTGRISGKYLWGSLKPALWSIPVIGILGGWVGSRLQFVPIGLEQSVIVTAHFEDAAAGFAHVVPVEGLRPEGPPIVRVQSGEAKWTLKGDREGLHRLVIRHEGQSYEVPVPVRSRGGRPPEFRTDFRRSSPGGDQLLAVTFALKEAIPSAWWNVWLQWLGWYFLVALVVALALRRPLGIQ